MPHSIQALRERRNGLCIEARKLLDDTKDKKWTQDNQSRYNQLTGEITDLDTKIEREQKLLDLTAEQHFQDSLKETTQGRKPKDSLDPLSEMGLFDTFMRRGDAGFSAQQIEKIQAALSTTTDSEGGYTVPEQVATRLIDRLADYSGMRKVAEIIRTSTGGPLSYPTSNGITEVGEIIAENGTASDADPSFGTVSLTPYKYGSKTIAVPIELLQDSAIDMENFVVNRIAARLGRITNQHFTVGTGTGQPTGIVTASGAGKVGATGQTTTVLYADLVDLIESVDIAYQSMPGCRWMFAQSMRATLRKLTDTTGRPIWTPGYEQGITGGAPDLLLGHAVQINNAMPTPAASAKSIIFGDLSKYIIRDVMQMALFRFTDSAYTRKGQVGFLAWMRTTGNLSDSAAVKHYQHAAS